MQIKGSAAKSRQKAIFEAVCQQTGTWLARVIPVCLLLSVFVFWKLDAKRMLRGQVGLFL